MLKLWIKSFLASSHRPTYESQYNSYEKVDNLNSEAQDFGIYTDQKIYINFSNT